ncbi:quinolinate synthase NadA [Alkalihalobacillus hwajinpoensis]|uniref:quinolinate synthase NadA n=1 Tax=Guptibacillus hwajinpoensis TaxID=208199 RepID=UPI001883F41F|nr:quinolinate synthase NadA [Pseudalkalibacillus hwajinpoensis]MBF0706392.1 quinolinate synthase NadA [Pseudalkalibacillus hwajinpoensis]
MSILDALKRSNGLPDRYKELSDQEMVEKITAIKAEMGERLYLPAHHYQKDEVVQFADDTGDSLQLAQLAARNKKAEAIVFCGVHFMAETADILTEEDQTVILPDMRAGCSMADMANIHQTERAWSHLINLFGETILPLTYVNSTAAIKGFVGRNGGATVTSSNAVAMVEWGFTQKERILFLPDQHLGRNTAYDLGIPLEAMAVWDPITDTLEYEGDYDAIKVILWKGHCSVHEKFTVQNIAQIRENDPDMSVIVHPECSIDVVKRSDLSGSTKMIIETIEEAEPGTKWAIGTEMNLVNRIIQQHPDKRIVSLNPNMCPCLTMNRIDMPHLLWALEEVQSGKKTNQIIVDQETSFYAIKALNRMLDRA